MTTPSKPDLVGTLTALSPTADYAAVIPIPLQPEFKLGRDVNRCDHVFSNSQKYISGVHCIIRTCMSKDKRSFHVYVEDRSLNGTFIDNQRVPTGARRQAELKHESILHFGGCPSTRFALILELYRPASIQSQFDMKQQLGAGSFGQVYSAISRRSGLVYAIKRIENRVKKGSTDKLEREIETLKLANHVNVIRLHGFKVDIKYIYLIMELADFGSVASILDEGWILCEADARTITRDVCCGLKHLHSDLKMIHRDIKPDNVLISKLDPLTIKIADFGLTKVMKGNTCLQTICGTVSFMAPEVATQAGGAPRHYDQKADCFSVGAMVYNMLSGNLPFDSHDVDLNTGRDNRVLTWEYIPKSTSAYAIDIMDKLMEWEASKRPTMQRALIHPWLRIEQVNLPPPDLSNASIISVSSWFASRRG